MNFETVYRNLGAELVRKGISAKEVSEILGVTVKTVRNKLQGKSDFTWSEVQKIREVLGGQDVFYLFDTSA